MENNWYVYRHRRLDNFSIFYVGIGKSANFFRAHSKSQRSVWWKNIIKSNEYSVEVLYQYLSKEEACELEVLLISEYKRKDCCGGTLVNMTDGGEGSSGHLHSEESKKKISNSNRGKHSFFGEDNHNFGKKRSIEANSKQGETMRGKKRTEDSKKKQSETVKKQYEEGKVHPQLGSKKTEEQLQKISEYTSGSNNPRAKKVIDTETGIVYGCIKEAAEYLCINSGTLRSYLNPNNNNKNKTNLKYYEIK